MKGSMGRFGSARRWKGMAAAIAFAAAAAGMPANARADEATRLDPIVVTATRIEQRVSEQPSAVSVVTREDIELKNPQVAGDVLRGIPGIDVQRTGSPGNRENIKIRGGLAAHTLVMIDGFPVNSPTLGSFDIGSLPAGDFERIEVIRGAQSAMYGSGAMGGVVNLIPRKGETGRQYGLGVAGGSFGTVQGNANAQGAGKDGNFHLGTGAWRSDGILPNDGTNLVSFLGTGETRVGGNSRVHAIVLSTDQEKGIPIDFGNPRDVNHRLDRRGFLSGVRWETEVSKMLTLSASGMIFDEFFREEDPADAGELFPFVFDDTTRTRKMDFRLQGRFSPGPVSTTFAGVEYEKDRASDTFRSNFGDTDLVASTFNRSLFLQQEFRPSKRAGLSLGARLDRNSEAGTQFNPKAAAFREFGKRGVRIRAAVGRGFRVPTISEKRDVFVGNQALKPEKTVSYEAGTDVPFAGKRGKVTGTYFYQAFTDLIQFDSSVPGPLGFGQLRNKGNSFSRGIESEVTFIFSPRVEAAFSYTWSDTWDGTSQKRIIGIPRHKAVTTLLLTPAPQFLARLDWQIESDQIDAPVNGTATRRPGYARVDAYARYRWAVQGAEIREIALTGKIQNLLDRTYQERIEFPAPRFNFIIGAEVKI
ncbi:MAG: TonB-dependent receptor [Deltaproteobacteria bacterium]|nr:TonB-dependent receptor [Deltaproteobacteria bacterium]